MVVHKMKGIFVMKGLFATLYNFSRKNRGGVLLLRILFGCDIPKEAKIASTVQFPHRALGVVIHPDVIIGENCFIQHHVTIGVNKGTTGTPKIGQNVFIGPYAMLLGDITIGDNAMIGAGTIVMKNIEANAIYTGSTTLVKWGQRE